MRAIRLPLLMLATVTLIACQNNTPATVAQNEQSIGTPMATTAPSSQAPDDATKQLAKVGINSAVLLGPLITQFSSLLQGYYAAQKAHPATSYRTLDLPDWTYQFGWYAANSNSPTQALLAQFEDANGVPAAWDVTLDANYTLGLHTGFPTDLTQVRLQIQAPLPSGGQVALTLIAPLPRSATGTIQATGSGSATVDAPLGNVGYEALDANFPIGGTLQPSDLGLKSVANSTALQFGGQYQQNGLVGTATIQENGQNAGTVALVNGQWTFQNSSGSYPLQ